MSGDIIGFGQGAVTVYQNFGIRWRSIHVSRCAAKRWVTFYLWSFLFGGQTRILVGKWIETRRTDTFNVTRQCTLFHIHVNEDVRTGQKYNEEEDEENGQIADTGPLDDFCKKNRILFVCILIVRWMCCIIVCLPFAKTGTQFRVSFSFPWHSRVSGSVVRHLR